MPLIRFSMAWVFVAAAMTSGCYLSHGLGEDVPADGGPRDASMGDASRPRDWTLRLSPETRRPCMDERDCDPGMHCVEHGDPSRARTCEVPCLMNGMTCPFMHACQGAASGWVCEWIGE